MIFSDGKHDVIPVREENQQRDYNEPGERTEERDWILSRRDEKTKTVAKRLRNNGLAACGLRYHFAAEKKRREQLQTDDVTNADFLAKKRDQDESRGKSPKY
jgi:hypothetical protein